MITATDHRAGAIPGLAFLSIAAGLLHAAVVVPHRSHGVATGAFAAFALFQVGWTAAVLLRPSRVVLVLGVLANSAAVGAYILSLSSGLSFIDFGNHEALRVPAAAATAFEVLLVLGAARLLVPRRRPQSGRVGPAGFGAAGLVLALAAVAAFSLAVPVRRSQVDATTGGRDRRYATDARSEDDSAGRALDGSIDPTGNPRCQHRQ